MLALFNLITIIMIYIDSKRYKSFFTPFILLSAIYLILIDLNNILIADIYNFYKVNNNTLIVLLLFFFVIFLISNFFACFINVPANTKSAVNKRNWIPFKVEYLLFIVGLIAYALSAVINLRAYGLNNMKGENDGILGHISSLSLLFAPCILMTIKKNNRLKPCLLIMALGVLTFIFASKYVIFINVFYAVLFLVIDKNLKLKTIIKSIIILAIFAVLVFVIIYCVVPLFAGGGRGGDTFAENFEFSIRYFFYYLLAPVIANNYTMTHSLANGASITFCVPINIFRAVFKTGEFIEPAHMFDFKYAEGGYTNVSGIIGESVYCLGLGGALLYIIFIFCMIYCFLIVYKNHNKYKMTLCLLLSTITFGFFVNFFTVSGNVLPIMYIFIIETIFQLKNTKKYKYSTEHQTLPLLKSK